MLVKGRYPLEGLRRLRALQRQSLLAELAKVNAQLERQAQRVEAANHARQTAQARLSSHGGELARWFVAGSVPASRLQAHTRLRTRLQDQLLRVLKHQQQMQQQQARLEAERIEIQRRLHNTVAEGQGMDQHRARWEHARALDSERAAEEEHADATRARPRRGEVSWLR